MAAESTSWMELATDLLLSIVSCNKSWQFNSSAPSPLSFHRTGTQDPSRLWVLFLLLILVLLTGNFDIITAPALTYTFQYILLTHSIHSEAQTEWAPTTTAQQNPTHDCYFHRCHSQKPPLCWHGGQRPCAVLSIKSSLYSTEMCCQCKKHWRLKDWIQKEYIIYY